MADNTEEEHIDDPGNLESETLPEEIIPFNEAETNNQNQQPEKMEVHHHPDLHHKPKKWKEYFLEFLMIFLAVTMGFFAESYREHLSDRSREKEYMSQLIGDLKKDMEECNINNNLSAAAIQISIGHYCDTLINILSKNSPVRSEVVTAYCIYQRIMFDWFTVYFEDATWSQLRNSNGFSNINNPNVIRQINDYYKWVGVINDYKDEIKERYSAINYNEGRKVFDQRMEEAMLDSIDSKQYTIIFEPSNFITQYMDSITKIQFIDHDPETILRLSNDLRSYKSLLASVNSMIKTQGNRAAELVQLITKEYHLKD